MSDNSKAIIILGILFFLTAIVSGVVGSQQIVNMNNDDLKDILSQINSNNREIIEISRQIRSLDNNDIKDDGLGRAIVNLEDLIEDLIEDNEDLEDDIDDLRRKTNDLIALFPIINY